VHQESRGGRGDTSTLASTAVNRRQEYPLAGSRYRVEAAETDRRYFGPRDPHTHHEMPLC
jgi:hypothetical protein